jgi:hypothetical protein
MNLGILLLMETYKLPFFMKFEEPDDCEDNDDFRDDDDEDEDEDDNDDFRDDEDCYDEDDIHRDELGQEIDPYED